MATVNSPTPGLGLVPKTPPEILRPRIHDASMGLRDNGILGKSAARRFAEDLGALDLEAQGLSYEELLSIERLLRSTAHHFHAEAPGTAAIRGPQGRPLPNFGAPFEIFGYTDCVGGADAETEARIATTELGILRSLGVLQNLDWQPTEPLNPFHIEAIVTSQYLSYRMNQIQDPERRWPHLVILANAAPRDPNNPSAKGCPFVFAELEGGAFYLGTLNEGGIELQGIKPFIKSLWHTTLGLEEKGTEEGKKPVGVFRSQFLLPLFRGIVEGNEALLDRELSVCEEIRTAPLRINSRDTFGNLKTNKGFAAICSELGVSFGDSVLVTIEGKDHPARLAHSHGDGKPHELLLVPGSSPFNTDPTVTRADLVINHGDASSLFARAKNGHDSIEVWAGRRIIISKEQNLFREA